MVRMLAVLVIASVLRFAASEGRLMTECKVIESQHKTRRPRGMTVKDAEAIIGGALGNAGKMPCRTYGLPAAECQTGSKLRELEGTPCGKVYDDNGKLVYRGCYAYNRGQYIGETVKAQYRRLDSITHPQWVDAMVLLIGRQSPEYFRWHDSGDIQSVDHLDRIVQIARRLPATRFWLPTQERKLVAQWRKANGALPPNLTIRVSAARLGMYTGTYANDPELTSSMVTLVEETPSGVHDCPSRHQGNSCGDCRACWERSVQCVAYHAH